MGKQLFQQIFLCNGFLVAALGGAGNALQLFFATFQVGKNQLQVDDLDVAPRVNTVGHVDDVFILKAPHYMGDGIGFADVGQKLVAQAFAFGGTLYQPGNVDKLHGGRQDPFRLDNFGQGIKARVGHGNDTAVGLNGAKGKVFGSNAGLGQGVEQGGLAYVGQTHNTAIKTHGWYLAG